MTLEKLLVECDVFYSFYIGITFDFNNAVNQQERISMRQDFRDLPYVQDGIGTVLSESKLLLSGLVEFFYELLVQRMPAFVRNDSAVDWPAYENKVANEVKDFVPDTFVFKAILVVNRAFGVDNQQVLWFYVFADSARLKLFRFGLEQESSRGCKFFFEAFAGKPETVDLSVDA